MNARELIRSLLDLLDRHEEKIHVDIEHTGTSDLAPETGEPVASRFRQILAMLQNDNPMIDTPYANSPNEVVAPISAVTTDAGGGVNGPKHPHDIRVKDPSAYPDQQEY